MTTTEHQFNKPAKPDFTAPVRLIVTAASVRDGRVGIGIANWAVARARATGASVTLIDLAETLLPDDGLMQPGGGPRSSIAAQIDRSDGFVIVTPEYNHSYPASLKRAIDWHYSEWMFKAATVVSYGAHGGMLATEHLCGVFAELHVATTRSTVGIRAPWNNSGPAGYDAPADVEGGIDKALTELTWWSTVLRQARTEQPFPR